MTKLSKTLVVVITITIFGLIGYLLFAKDVSNKEAGLISLLLTILSFVVSYLISFHFAEETYQKAIEEVKEQHLANLKTYALNAAEKVGNLSNELTRLSIYLQEQLEVEDENIEIENHTLSERLESAIHIINTLKSVNDTSLSDWRGVIGEELKEQKEEQIERENELKEILSRVEELVDQKSYARYDNGTSKEIKELKKDLAIVLNSVSGNFIKPRKSNKQQKQEVISKCPNCDHDISYKQRPSEKSFKPVKCTNCQKKSTARWSHDKGFYLDLEKELSQFDDCEWCKEKFEVKYSSVPYTTTYQQCPNCRGQLKVLSNIGGIKISKYGESPFSDGKTLTEDLITQIEGRLPQQPWPTGIHKDIAAELKIPNFLVSNAITKLIERGKFFPQVNGVVYDKPKTS